jgi:flagellin-like protein
LFKLKRLNDRAVSPIFATLIVLAVVTTLFVPVFIWASTFTAQSRDSTQFSSVQATERIVIEEVSLASGQSPQTCTIYVRNIGETSVKINDVLISTTANQNPQIYQASQIATVKPGSTTPLTYILKGQLIQINIANVFPIIAQDTTCTIQVFTTRGVGDTFITVVK